MVEKIKNHTSSVSLKLKLNHGDTTALSYTWIVSVFLRELLSLWLKNNLRDYRCWPQIKIHLLTKRKDGFFIRDCFVFTTSRGFV